MMVRKSCKVQVLNIDHYFIVQKSTPWIEEKTSVLRLGSDRSVRPVGSGLGHQTGPSHITDRLCKQLGTNRFEPTGSMFDSVTRSVFGQTGESLILLFKIIFSNSVNGSCM